MTPSARVQAAIEILDKVIEAARRQGAPADRIIGDWGRSNRYAGSKDRRAIRDLIYRAIRECGEVPRSGRAAMIHLAEEDGGLAALFDGSQYGPQPIGDGEEPAHGSIAPEWLEDRLIASGISEQEAEALLGRAPLDMRVNRLKADRETLDIPVEAEHLPVPDALRLPSGTQVEQWPAFRDGLIEVQDAGSQLACRAVAARPGETVIDLCAGAGGKTLSLAAAMENRGILVAADTDRGRLSRLSPRAERAGVSIVREVLMNPGQELKALADWHGKADAVLVDAPCSGTGTWRRNPESRWRLTPGELARLTDLQQRLLAVASELVKPGGRITYITCSLLDEEGKDQVERFLSVRPSFTAQALDLPLGRAHGQGIRISPHHDGTDGFFIASLSAPC